MVVKAFFVWLTENKRSTECRGTYEEKFFDLSYRFQHVIGMSPVDSSWLYKLYRLLIMVFVFSIIVGEFNHLYHETDVDVIIDNISVTIIHLICVYRFCAMIWNLDTYNQISRAMEGQTFDVETKGRQRLLNTWAVRNKTYFLLLLGIGTCTLATWYVYPLVDEVDYNFPVSTRLPFDHRTPFRYAWSYTYVLLAFHYISYFVITNDLISLCVLVHMACQFNVLGDCFRNVLEDSKKSAEASTGRSIQSADLLAHKSADKWADKLTEQLWRTAYIDKLKRHIRQHQFLLQNAAALKKVLSAPMLGQLLASGLLICFVAYEVTATANVNVAKFLMTIQYLAYTLLQLYILCRWCNEINVQSENIGEAVYFSGWEGGAGGVRGAGKLLLLVMVRSRRPVVLTAGGIYDLSLESYMTLVKTSYSALTVLLRLRRK